jgi:hypothetical protein
MKKLSIGAFIIAILAFVGTFFPHQVKLGSYEAIDATGLTTIGNITQLNPNAVNISLGTWVIGGLNQGANGWIASFSTSTALTPSQFCGIGAAGPGAVYQIINTPANATLTLPSIVASSTWQACGSPPAGAESIQYIVNDSTNTVSQVAGAGIHIEYASGTANLLQPSSTWIVTGIWDTTSTLNILTGMQYK